MPEIIPISEQTAAPPEAGREAGKLGREWLAHLTVPTAQTAPQSIRDDLTIDTDSEIRRNEAQVTESLERLPLPRGTSQMIVVTSAGWEAKAGSLELYEKSKGHWHSTGERWPVELGRNGMGWGRGVLEGSGASVKHEGDGKAPAGVFQIGTAFGYEKQSPAGTQLPYKQATAEDYFIDDTKSVDYNTWKRLRKGDDPSKHWQSFEKMKRDDERYELGLVVNHNTTPTVPGGGSAIFLHVWKEPGQGTAGCTSMSEINMRELLHWLKPTSAPLLMQLPTTALSDFSQHQLSRY